MRRTPLAHVTSVVGWAAVGFALTRAVAAGATQCSWFVLREVPVEDTREVEGTDEDLVRLLAGVTSIDVWHNLQNSGFAVCLRSPELPDDPFVPEAPCAWRPVDEAE